MRHAGQTRADSSLEFLNNCFTSVLEVEAPSCLLRAMQEQNLSNSQLAGPLSDLISSGFTLRTTPPGSLGMHAEKWVGSRLYLYHESQLQASSRLVSIACSQLGRQHQNLPQWPELVQRILADVACRNLRLLIADKTTLAAAQLELASRSQLNFLRVFFPKDLRTSWQQWLLDALLIAQQELDRNRLFVSPLVQDSDTLAPLQDAIAVLLADQVYGLSIRRSGKVAELLKIRLECELFSAGSTFVLLPQQNNGQDWLQAGAVGWIHLRGDFGETPLPYFRCSNKTGYQQLTSLLPASLCDDANGWLVHCTRGSMYQPKETQRSSIYRHLTQGEAIPFTPWMQLNKICFEKKLLGSNWLQRSEHPVVSLSAVPLPQLQGQRSFRSHLGRWDWEPYGFLICRKAVERLGGRQVIYGDDQEYENLSPDQRTYFQPCGKAYDWTLEEEWRIVGDLDFESLGLDEIRVFVRTKNEAAQLSRQVEWPVFWLEE